MAQYHYSLSSKFHLKFPVDFLLFLFQLFSSVASYMNIHIFDYFKGDWLAILYSRFLYKVQIFDKFVSYHSIASTP